MQQKMFLLHVLGGRDTSRCLISGCLKVCVVTVSGFNNALYSLYRNWKIKPLLAIIVPSLHMFGNIGEDLWPKDRGAEKEKKKKNAVYGMTSRPSHLPSRWDFLKTVFPNSIPN